MAGRAIRQSRSDYVFIFTNYFLLSLILLIVLYPLVFAMSASVSNPATLLTGEMILFPKDFTLISYQTVLREQKLWLGYKNTIGYTVIGVLVNLIMTILGAYPLSRKDFKGGAFLSMAFAFTMFFSGGLIPTYLIVQKLGLINSFWVMVLPGAVSMTNLIITRTYFTTSIPYELQESAFIDGCNNFRILTRIMLPLSKPILAVLVVFYGVEHWNAYFNALIYFTDEKMYPLQLILRNILLQNQLSTMTMGTSMMADQIIRVEGLKYAVIVVASLPVLLLYPFAQRYFIKGVMIGALKG